MTPRKRRNTRTSSGAAKRLYRVCRLLGMSPASSRAEVAAAIREGIRLAAATRAGVRS